MSNKLKQFLAEWLAWAEADAPGHPVFTAQSGLCRNLDRWAEDDDDLEVELGILLNGEIYPFGEDEYDEETIYETHHRNPDRLAWVRKQLEAV